MDTRLTHLQGKRVLVTRAVEQAEREMETLREVGAIPFHFPLIEIQKPSDDYASLDEALSHLHTYTWIVFTSVNAVEVFFSRLRGRGVPESIRIAAVGPSTAVAIEERNVRVSLIPFRHHAEGLLTELLTFVKKDERVLFPRACDGRGTIVEGLRAQGIEVDLVEAYRTVLPASADGEELKKLIAREKIDTIIFASPSAVEHFVRLLGSEEARAFAKGHEIIPTGPVTEEAVKRALHLTTP